MHSSTCCDKTLVSFASKLHLRKSTLYQISCLVLPIMSKYIIVWKYCSDMCWPLNHNDTCCSQVRWKIHPVAPYPLIIQAMAHNSFIVFKPCRHVIEGSFKTQNALLLTMASTYSTVRYQYWNKFNKWPQIIAGSWLRAY